MDHDKNEVRRAEFGFRRESLVGLQADEDVGERARRHVVGDRRVADVPQHDKAELAGLALLVAMHRFDEGIDGHRRGQRRRQTNAPDQRLDAVGEARRGQTELLGQAGGGDEPDANGLTMGQCPTADLLEGVGERVPEVEHRPARLLERVVLDDGDLDLDRLGDEHLQPAEGIALLMAQPVPRSALQLGEQRRPGEQRMLDDLGHP